MRARLESVIPEILKRAVEIGVEKARESPDDVKQFVHDLKVPKELAHYLFQQIDDTKNGLFRVVAKEIRDFLEHTNFAGEVQKLLTTVQFEVNTTIRFTPNDGREPRKTDPREAAEGEESDREQRTTEATQRRRRERRRAREPSSRREPSRSTASHARGEDLGQRAPRRHGRAEAEPRFTRLDVTHACDDRPRSRALLVWWPPW